jgi:protein SCO1/2
MKNLRLIGVIALLSLGILGCGADQTSMVGLVRDQPLNVSGISLPDETPGATEPLFVMKAQPNELLMVYFGYTMCPDLCPTTLADFRSALSRIDAAASRVDLAFITVDPERDTADRLAPYLASFVDQYHVLRTTDFSQLQKAQDAFLAASSITTNDSGVIEVSHTATAYFVDENGLVVDEIPFGLGADGFENDLKILINQLDKG